MNQNFAHKINCSDLQQNWNLFSNKLVEKFGQATYDSWFKNIELVEENKHTVCLRARSRFIKEWIIVNHKQEIFDLIKSYKADLIDLEIIAEKKIENNTPEFSSETKIEINNNSNDNEDNFGSSLDPRYSFENFIKGDENKMAYTAVKSLVSDSSLLNNINSLYISASVGLGKSHLLSALASSLEGKNYLYFTSERFTYHYTKAAKNSELLDFKEKFENLDFLLIDDIHFLQGKKSTQQEIVNIIESLVSNNKKVIFTSDRKLNDLDDMNKKLKSFLSSGIISQIDKPGESLRAKIIKHKCELNDYHLDDDLIKIFAAQNFSNVREIEGALNKLMIYKNIFEQKLDKEKLLNIVSDYVVKTLNRKLEPEEIVKKLSKYFKLSNKELISKSRKKDLVFARNLTIFIVKEQTKLSLSQIGSVFGNRDHATILHSYNKIKNSYKSDLTLKFEIEKILEYISS